MVGPYFGLGGNIPLGTGVSSERRRLERRQNKTIAPTKMQMTASPPITPPTMAPTGVEDPESFDTIVVAAGAGAEVDVEDVSEEEGTLLCEVCETCSP